MTPVPASMAGVRGVVMMAGNLKGAVVLLKLAALAALEGYIVYFA